MSRRRSLIAFAAVSAIGLIGLLIAAATDRRPNAFTIRQQISGPLATIARGQSACDGPIAVRSAFSGIRVVIGTDGPPGASLTLSVRSEPGGAALASTSIFARTHGKTYEIGFGRTIRAGRMVDICMLSRGPRLAAFFGTADEQPGARLIVAGKVTGSGAAIVFLRPHPPSLLSELPTVFERAALFKPGWTGVWTYWVLLAGVLAAFLLVGRALVAAAAEDA